MDKAVTTQQKNIVILGGGTAGWMTAAALSKLLPEDNYSITLIESQQIARVGVGEATLPHLRFFNERLGINEAEFMRATQATFKVGIEFVNWQEKGASYLHPFGEYGHKINQIDFHHAWLKQHLQGNTTSFSEYSLPVMASLAGKFDFPSAEQHSVLSTYGYSYHIDAGRYAQFLQSFSTAHGVTRVEGKVTEVLQHPNQEIKSLMLANGQHIEGDFFIDCSGFNGKLISQTLNVEFDDWTQWLPCNTAVALPTQYTQAPLPYTKAIAQDAGWIWRIPLQHRLGNGHVFCDAFTNLATATDTLLSSLLGEPLQQPVSFKFAAGKPKKSWVKNCVAIGLAAGFLEPLESTTLYLIQSSIMKLLEVFPEHGANDVAELEIKAFEFNRAIDNEMLRIRDFLILHYHATEREDTEFWRYCKNMTVPDSLVEKIALFKEHGYIENYQHGLFLEPSWLAVYLGQGIIPQSYDERIDLISNEELLKQMTDYKQQIEKAVATMPKHHEMIKQYLNHSASDQNKAQPSMSLYGRKNA